MVRKQLLDADWAGRAFLVPKSSLEDRLTDRRRYYTSASRKFTNTSLGGSFEINALPQFTENADLSHASFYAGHGSDPRNSEGRFYSEVIRDNAQIIHIRAGVPKFNSMTTFFGNFYNLNAGAVVRTGREPGLLYSLGRVLGTIGTLPLQPFILAGSAIKFFADIPRGKYYYLKPTMFPYWMAVQNMMNGFMAPMGLLAGFTPSDHTKFFDPKDMPGERDKEAMLRQYGPLVNADGAFDVHSLATKAQQLAKSFREAMELELDKLSGDERNRPEEIEKIIYNGIDRQVNALRAKTVSLYEYQSAYQAFQGKTETNWEVAGEFDDSSKGWLAQAAAAYGSVREAGSQFVSFRVNWTGSQSSSFSNSAGQSSIQSQINGMSSQARQVRFSMADGNISGGVVGQAIQSVIGAVKDVASGALASVQLSGFMAVAGNAFADIQKVYESSSADLNRMTFTIPLKTWCHDDWIRCQNIYLPLASILALGLPRATGPASYDGPFLLEVFNQGRATIREGMIESISIEVGTGDAGWAPGMKPLSIDVNVTIVDLSSIMSMAINPVVGNLSSTIGGVAGIFGETAADIADTTVSALSQSTYSEDNKYIDWMATMASLPLESFINSKRRWRLRMAQAKASLSTARSPGATANYLGDTTIGRIDRFFNLEDSTRY